MAQTTTKKTASRTPDGRVQGVKDSTPKAEAKAVHDKAYPVEPLDTPTPRDPALVQQPDGTATPDEANERRVETPAPEHVEAAGKSDTVHPLPSRVHALKDHNAARVAAGEQVEPVGPGNAQGMTDRAAPAGDAPKVNPGTFLHPQTKEQVEATKRYSEPHQLPADTVYVTLSDGTVETVKGAKGRLESDGSLSILAGPLDPTVDPKVVKKFRAGTFSYHGRTPQP